MRILYVINTLDAGGAESVLYNLLSYLRANRKSVHVEVLTLYAVGHFGSRLIEMGLPVHCLGLQSKYAPSGVWKIIQFLRSRSFDVIHSHLFPTIYFVALASRFFPNVKWIYTEHSIWNRRRKYRLLRLLERSIYSRFDKVIAVSQVVAEGLTEWLPSVKPKLVIIPNAVPIPSPEMLSLWKEVKTKTPVILFVGRLHQAKGLDILFHCLTLLQVPEYKMKIVGEGNLRTQLEALATELGIRERIEFLGFRSDVQSLMLNADCLVLPSRWEGMPMVVLEAMALGTPVIASRVGGIAEVIEDGKTGWLVQPEHPEELANVLSCVLSKPERSFEVVTNALAVIRMRYSIEKMAEETIACYLSVLERAGAVKR